MKDKLLRDLKGCRETTTLLLAGLRARPRRMNHETMREHIASLDARLHEMSETHARRKRQRNPYPDFKQYSMDLTPNFIAFLLTHIPETTLSTCPLLQRGTISSRSIPFLGRLAGYGPVRLLELMAAVPELKTTPAHLSPSSWPGIFEALRIPARQPPAALGALQQEHDTLRAACPPAARQRPKGGKRGRPRKVLGDGDARPGIVNVE